MVEASSQVHKTVASDEHIRVIHKHEAAPARDRKVEPDSSSKDVSRSR